MPQVERPPAADPLTVLALGEVEVEGRMPWSSNHTFLVRLCHAEAEMAAIYKPGRGERPLWDFPDGVFVREAAAWELSRFLGWGLVPETIVRHDAPLGPGSLQRFVAADFSQHYFTLLEDPAHHDSLRAIATLDVLLNNADRKSGHCLLGEDGSIWAIDHGLSFHTEPKLRTVIWDFAGEPVPARLIPGIERLVDAGPPEGVADVLDDDECEALLLRAETLLDRRILPAPHPDRRHYPWPLV
ncbi:MAG TPA: SCO1664 family protein [Acidimicrobiales bacterium]|nr:SCO1664 family protein [Acidimicrobiales bacterium]